MTPTTYYHRLIESEQILRDDQQAAVIEQLEIIFNHIVQKNSGLQTMLGLGKLTSIEGLYLWGQVGIGKTFLLDCFYHCLPLKNKIRIHFHQFMKRVHQQLAKLQGQTSPLTKIAKQFAKETCVICFDELLVNDIADAMILAGLFDALYKENITLLFTSNTAPDNLYLHGLHRPSFIPAIQLIKKYSKIIELTAQSDYRFRNYQENNYYYFPLGEAAEQKLHVQFDKNRQGAPENKQALRILDRDIPVRKIAAGVIWFDYPDICGIPRSQQDYLEIVKQFHTIIVSNITAIEPMQHDLARSFINLVDILYDAHRKLIISASVPPEQLCLSGKMLFEFARTRSRLAEMQTQGWQEQSDQLASS